MEGFKEFQGKDLDDAIGQACSYYDTLREKLEIDIIHDSKSGIFGIVGARKAKIKARRVQLRTAVDSILGRNRDGGENDAPPPAKSAGRAPKNEPKTEKAPRSSENPRPVESAHNENVRPENTRRDEPAAEGRKPRAPRPPRTPSAPRNYENRTPEFRNDGNSILSGQVQGVTLDPEDDEEASFGPGNEMPADSHTYNAPMGLRDDRAPKARRPRNPRPSAPRAEGSSAVAAAHASAPTSVLAGTLDNDALNEDALSEGLPMIPFDQLDQDRLRAVSLEAVGRLVAPIVGDVPLTVELGDNRVNVVLECGDDSGLLIGREGQTLASLQYLASRLVSRAMTAAVRVQLDAGEYRLRQDEKLRDLALSLAERVRASGKSHSTRPLSSYHRRIVHMALQEVADVQTRSSGDGALKRVVIQKKRGN
ncbi:MAG: Jag N-terminal domain-containing protein [Desulfovibrionaceae bacterium]